MFRDLQPILIDVRASYLFKFSICVCQDIFAVLYKVSIP